MNIEEFIKLFEENPNKAGQWLEQNPKEVPNLFPDYASFLRLTQSYYAKIQDLPEYDDQIIQFAEPLKILLREPYFDHTITFFNYARFAEIARMAPDVVKLFFIQLSGVKALLGSYSDYISLGQLPEGQYLRKIALDSMLKEPGYSYLFHLFNNIRDLIRLYPHDVDGTVIILTTILKNKSNPMTAEDYIAFAMESPNLASTRFDLSFVASLFTTSAQFIELASQKLVEPAGRSFAQHLINASPKHIASLFTQKTEFNKLCQVSPSLAEEIKSIHAQHSINLEESPVEKSRTFQFTKEQKKLIIEAMNQALLKTRYSYLENGRLEKLTDLQEVLEEFKHNDMAVDKFIEFASIPRDTWCFFKASPGKTGSIMAFKAHIENNDMDLFNLLFLPQMQEEEVAEDQVSEDFGI